MRGGRIVLLVLGALLVLAGLGVGSAGVAAGWAHLQRDADGYVSTPSEPLVTDAYAVTAKGLELVMHPGRWTPWDDDLDLRLRVSPPPEAGPLFAGVAPLDAVDAYLEDVAHTEVAGLDRGDPRYGSVPGARAPELPGEQDFWVAEATGDGPQDLEWTAASGRWAVVVMNADGSPGVQFEAAAAARTSLLGPLAVGLLAVGLVLLGAGAAMILVAVHDEPADPAGTRPAAPPSAVAGAAPLRLTGHYDPPVSRGLWLVKWLLLLPHYVVLAVLWAAFVLLTLVAAVAILVTGRYPRGIFAFNLGVLRWTWRVGFYGYSALGTDRYPPFTLDDVEYPAHLDIAYPERLSRPLVLVKSWLLALPHLVIVGLFTGGVATWTYQVSAQETWRLSLGGGLIGVLVLVAGIGLLVTRRYPSGLFDLIVGLDRWVFRVVAYVALMTDQYPPFRLDTGGEEPPVRPRPPAPRPAATDERTTTTW